MGFLLIVRTRKLSPFAWYFGIHGCSSIQLDFATALLFHPHGWQVAWTFGDPYNEIEPL
jgi:hypothetical protein